VRPGYAFHKLRLGFDPKLTLGTAHAITSAYPDRQSKERDRKDLPAATPPLR
jgi:hypothetical protein